MTQTSGAKSPSDQKTLNEEIIEGLVEVARRNPQHAVELFGVPLGVAMRLAAMPDAQIDDLATTPVALWRPALTERLVRRLPERRPMLTPDHEVYRPLVKRINRLALATFVRYADDPASAALVCDITDREVIRALQELPAFAFLEWGGNPGTLLAVPRLSDSVIDRLLRDDDGVEPGLRGLLALTQCCEQEFALIRHAIQEESAAYRVAERTPVGKRPGRPPASFLMPGTSSLILAMLRHQMRPTEVEERMLATSDVRAAQLRGIAEVVNPKLKRDKNAPRDRTRDNRDLWGQRPSPSQRHGHPVPAAAAGRLGRRSLRGDGVGLRLLRLHLRRRLRRHAQPHAERRVHAAARRPGHPPRPLCQVRRGAPGARGEDRHHRVPRVRAGARGQVRAAARAAGQGRTGTARVRRLATGGGVDCGVAGRVGRR